MSPMGIREIHRSRQQLEISVSKRDRDPYEKTWYFYSTSVVLKSGESTNCRSNVNILFIIKVL